MKMRELAFWECEGVWKRLERKKLEAGGWALDGRSEVHANGISPRRDGTRTEGMERSAFAAWRVSFLFVRVVGFVPQG